MLHLSGGLKTLVLNLIAGVRLTTAAVETGNDDGAIYVAALLSRLSHLACSRNERKREGKREIVRVR